MKNLSQGFCLNCNENKSKLWKEQYYDKTREKSGFAWLFKFANLTRK